MADIMFIIAKSDLPFSRLPLTAAAPGTEFEFGQGWRMFVPIAMADIPGSLADIAQAFAKETRAPSIVAYAGAGGYLALVFCEKGRSTSLVVIGVELAKEANLVDAKFKHHPLVAIGWAGSWSKKARLKDNYDALKLAANRTPSRGTHGEQLLLTWLVGLGLPGAQDIDPYWNQLGESATAQRKAFWTPGVGIDVTIDL
jgi:hypothetical protein